MYQKVIIIGNLGADPEMRFTPTGRPVTHFPVAVNRRWTDNNGEQREATTWFRVTAWGKLAETCNAYLSKGRLVMVEGEVKASAWIDQQGQARATLELTARTVKFLGKGNGNNGEARSGVDEAFAIDEDIPF